MVISGSVDLVLDCFKSIKKKFYKKFKDHGRGFQVLFLTTEHLKLEYVTLSFQII